MPPRISRRAVADRDAPAQTQQDSDADMEETQGGSGSGSVEQLAKGLVRYALSCEQTRKVIRRQDVNDKVLGLHTRLFRAVFDQANSELMDVFGMQFAELPKGERVTVRQKRAAAGESQSKAASTWVLQTAVPLQYRVPEAVGPARAHDDTAAAYVGLYTMVVALITIAGGRLGEDKLDRALRRMDAEQTTPVDSKEKTLALMVKDGYITKVRETVGGDETVEFVVGPRGRVEVGAEGFAELVRTVYGGGDGVEQKIKRTLDVAGWTGGGPAAAPAQAGRKRGRDDE